MVTITPVSIVIWAVTISDFHYTIAIAKIVHSNIKLKSQSQWATIENWDYVTGQGGGWANKANTFTSCVGKPVCLPPVLKVNFSFGHFLEGL